MTHDSKPAAHAADPANTSKEMTKVRPLRGKPSVAAPYDPGFEEEPEKSPWVDEGRPETSG